MKSPAAVEVRRVRANAKLPEYTTKGAAGADLRAAVEGAITIAPGTYTKIPTGIAVAIPAGYEIQVRPRSGLAAKHGITLLNSPGTIDSDYRGEVEVLLINHGNQEFVVQNGDRIAQMVVAKVEQAGWLEVGELEATERGEGGFGSTGVR